jgi:hypothetical protein
MPQTSLSFPERKALPEKRGAEADQIRLTLGRIGPFFNDLSRTAEPLSVAARRAVVLSVAFIKWFVELSLPWPCQSSACFWRYSEGVVGMPAVPCWCLNGERALLRE